MCSRRARTGNGKKKKLKMGNVVCSKDIYGTKPQFVPLRDLFEFLQFSARDVADLLRAFESFDVDHSGLVSTHELFVSLSNVSSVYCKRVFSLFDEDKSGQIDFREFVLTLWNYCTLSRTSLVLFAFDLYDTDCTGSLSMEEVDGMLVDLYGQQVTTHPQAMK